MAIIIAEYLGKRTNSDTSIHPYPHKVEEGKGIQFEHMGTCPFNELPCKKMNKKSNALFPVCSLRRNGELYIICEHRLISTSRQADGLPLSPYQNKMLLILAKEIFAEELSIEQLLYKSEITMASRSRADYMLSVTSDVVRTYGPRKLIVEMQGGGETSNTGDMTARLAQWSLLANPTNAFLSKPISVGLIQTNAWRRLQEQILTKGSVAKASGNGLVACVGTHVFDQVSEKLNNFAGLSIPKTETWDTAIIAYSEDTSGARIGDAIPLKIDSSRRIYTRYQDLAKRLIERGEPDPIAFSGPWKKLTGEVVNEDGTAFEKPPRVERKRASLD